MVKSGRGFPPWGSTVQKHERPYKKHVQTLLIALTVVNSIKSMSDRMQDAKSTQKKHRRSSRTHAQYNYTKFLFCIIVFKICSYNALYYILYIIYTIQHMGYRYYIFIFYILYFMLYTLLYYIFIFYVLFTAKMIIY